MDYMKASQARRKFENQFDTALAGMDDTQIDELAYSLASRDNIHAARLYRLVRGIIKFWALRAPIWNAEYINRWAVKHDEPD